MQQLFYENYEQNKKGHIRDSITVKSIAPSLCTRTKTRLPVQGCTATCSRKSLSFAPHHPAAPWDCPDEQYSNTEIQRRPPAGNPSFLHEVPAPPTRGDSGMGISDWEILVFSRWQPAPSERDGPLRSARPWMTLSCRSWRWSTPTPRPEDA